MASIWIRAMSDVCERGVLSADPFGFLLADIVRRLSWVTWEILVRLSMQLTLHVLSLGGDVILGVSKDPRKSGNRCSNSSFSVKGLRWNQV